MDSIAPTVTNSTKHTKNESTSSSQSENTIFSFQTGATSRANLDTTASENVTVPIPTTVADETSPTNIEDDRKAHSWRKFRTTIRRRHTFHQSSERAGSLETSITTPPNALLSQKSNTMLSLPELPRRQSLIEELDILPRIVPATAGVIEQTMPPASVRKRCTKCGKPKRPKSNVRAQPPSQSKPKPRTTLAVITEGPTEPAPLKSPTNLSDASTLCVSESSNSEQQPLQKSTIYSIDPEFEFDIYDLVPEDIKYMAPDYNMGLTFESSAVPNLVVETPTSDTMDDDPLRNSLSVPDITALDTILRNMQALLDRTNSELSCSISAFDLTSSTIPREIV